jgi:hypothetical protein
MQYTNSLQLEEITVKGTFRICTHLNVSNGASLVVDDADDEMVLNRQGQVWPRPRLQGNGSFDVSAGTLRFEDCDLVHTMNATWNLTGGRIHVTSDVGYASPTWKYIASDIDISGGELEVDQLSGLPNFKTTGQLEMSGGTLDIDGDFKVDGGLEYSGGTIEVASGYVAEFGDVP